MAAATSAVSLDGRTARRLENRAKILDGALDVVASGDELTADAIAARAGVSVRSVYNHFASASELVAGMYERGTQKVMPLLAELPAPEAPFAERVRRWTRVRTQILEEVAPVRWHAMVAEERHPEMQPQAEALRRAHRDDVRRTFPELPDEAAVDAVAALTDSLGWKALRRHQGLPPAAACAVIEATIRRLAGTGRDA
jgi:AcrR family transcriptional regulator